MKILSLVLLASAAAMIAPPVCATSILDVLKMPKGSPSAGPGAGSVGVLSKDAGTDVAKTTAQTLEQNLANMTAILSKLSSQHTDETAEIQKAMGEAVAGEYVDAMDLTIDPIDFAVRQRTLEVMKASSDADSFQPFILYLEALQTHEARMLVYGTRLNELITIHNQKLNYQQRIRLAAQMSLLQGQITLAEQEVRDVENRARISGSTDRLKEAEQEERKRKFKHAVDGAVDTP